MDFPLQQLNLREFASEKAGEARWGAGGVGQCQSPRAALSLASRHRQPCLQPLCPLQPLGQRPLRPLHCLLPGPGWLACLQRLPVGAPHPPPRLARGPAPPLPSRVGHRLRVPPQRLAHQREPGAVQRGLRPLLRAGGAPRQEALSRPGPPQPLEVGGCCLPGPRLQPPSPLWRDVGGGRGAAAHAAPGGAFVNKFTKKKNHTKKPKSGGVKGWGWVLRLGMGSV